MKRVIAVLIALFLLASVPAYAANPEPTPEPNPLDEIDVPRSVQRIIYDDFEERFNSYRRGESETVQEFRDRIAEEVAKDYKISAVDARDIYACGLVGYLYDLDPAGLKLLYGNKTDIFVQGTTLIVMAKINMLLSNKQTVAQNYHNVVDLIQNQGCGEFHKIRYSAYMNAQNGQEVKVVGFTLTQDVIEAVAEMDGSPASILESFVTNLYIHPQLR